MMIYVDVLLSRFGLLIALHCAITYILYGIHIKNRSDTYNKNTFVRGGQTKVKVMEDSVRL